MSNYGLYPRHYKIQLLIISSIPEGCQPISGQNTFPRSLLWLMVHTSSEFIKLLQCHSGRLLQMTELQSVVSTGASSGGGGEPTQHYLVKGEGNDSTR